MIDKNIPRRWFGIFRKFKTGRVAKQPIMTNLCKAENELWQQFKEQRVWAEFPESWQFVCKELVNDIREEEIDS
jgi:hypothetical protein